MEYNNYLAPVAPARNGYADNLRLCNVKMFMYLVGVGWGSVSYGYSASTVGLPGFVDPSYALSDLQFYIYDIGGIFGALTAGILCDRFGRKPTIIVGATVALISCGILAASINLAMFLVFRALVGLGTTIMLVAIPVWMTEIAPPKGRAIITSAHPILILLGQCLSQWIALPFSNNSHFQSEWRPPIAVGCLWPFLCLISCLYVPESPRYLLRNGKEEKARKIINELHSRPEDVNHYHAHLEFEHMRQQINNEKTSRAGYRELFRQRSLTKRVLIGCLLNFFVLTSGIVVISIYDHEVYDALGYESGIGLRENAVATASFGMSFLLLFFVEWMPRRYFITLGFLGCFACLIVQMRLVESSPFSLGFSSANSRDEADHGVLIAILAMTYVFSFFYANFLNGSRFFYTAEIFPNPLRAKGMGLAMLALSVTDMIWSIVLRYGSRIGWKYFIVFTVFDAIACSVVFRVFPDSREMPLEDIGQLFGDFGPTNNMWGRGQPLNPNMNPQTNPQVAELHYNQRQFEMGGAQRLELYGVHPPAEVAGQGRYEMYARNAPVEAGGGNVYEVPGGLNPREGSYRRWG